MDEGVYSFTIPRNEGFTSMRRPLARAIRALFVACAIVGQVPGAEEPKTGQKVDPAPSWHLVDVWWDIGSERSFESCSVDITIGDDVPDSLDLDVAPIGMGLSCKTPSPGSVESLPIEDSRGDRLPSPHGPGFVFSMWEERSGETARAARGGSCQGLRHEALTVSVRRPFAWKSGRYTCELIRRGMEEIDGKPFTRVGASVRSHDTREEIFVGAFRVPGETLVLSRQLSSFVAVRGPCPDVTEIPRLAVTFGGLRINGQPVEKPTALVEYPEGVPEFAEALGQGTSVVVTLGGPIKERSRRRVDVVGALASHPESGLLIGKFDLLATYTYARSLRDGFPEPEAKVRGITAAVMGARARGLKRGGPQTPVDSGTAKAKAETARTRKKEKTLTAESFNHQVADKLGPWFPEVFLPTMKHLVAARLSYEKLKSLLEMPPEVGSKISAKQFEQRASAYLEDAAMP
jgi:hypothetical protein